MCRYDFVFANSPYCLQKQYNLTLGQNAAPREDLRTPNRDLGFAQLRSDYEAELVQKNPAPEGVLCLWLLLILCPIGPRDNM